MTSAADPMYTLKETDHDSGLPSFRRLFLEIADPTGYRQAKELLGGWEHWLALCSSKWFSDYIDPILQELEIKLRSEAILAVYLIMTKGEKSALPAAKIFMDGDFLEKRGKGRPSKQEIQAEVKKQARISERVKADAERIGLSVISNNE